MTENAPSCVSQNGKAKSQIVAEVAKIVRRYGLDYEAWRYVSRRVRQACELRPAKKGRKLPRIGSDPKPCPRFLLPTLARGPILSC